MELDSKAPSNMDLINEVFDIEYPVNDSESVYYFIGFAEYINKNISTDKIFHFLKTLCTSNLTKKQKLELVDVLNIKNDLIKEQGQKQKVIYKERIVYREKKKNKLNNYDDY